MAKYALVEGGCDKYLAVFKIKRIKTISNKKDLFTSY